MMNEVGRALAWLLFQATPAAWFILSILLLLGGAHLIRRCFVLPLLSRLGWHWLYGLGRRRLRGTLPLLRGTAQVWAAWRWLRGVEYRAADVPLSAVLLCEGWLLDVERAHERAGAAAERDDGEPTAVALLDTLAELYCPAARRLRRYLPCRSERAALDRSLWYSARAATLRRDASEFQRRWRRLAPSGASEASAESWLGPVGCDARRAADLLSHDAHAVTAAARYFAELLDRSDGEGGDSGWPGTVSRLTPWLHFLAQNGDWHALAAAATTLLERLPTSAQLVPVCQLLAAAYRAIGESAQPASWAGRYYALRARGYAALAVDLGLYAPLLSHPLATAAPTALASAAARPGQVVIRAPLSDIAAWRSAGWWLGATAAAAVSLLIVESVLVVGTIRRYHRSTSLETAQAPAACRPDESPLHTLSDQRNLWLLGEHGLSRYEPKTRWWTCYRYVSTDSSDRVENVALSSLLDAGEGIVKLRPGAAGPLLITSAGRLGELVPDRGTARIHFRSGAPLKTAELPATGGGPLLAADAGDDRIAFGNGRALLLYDGRSHSWSENWDLDLTPPTEATGLVATGSAPTFWLGTASGLFAMEGVADKPHAVGRLAGVQGLALLEKKAQRLLAVSRSTCDGSGAAATLLSVVRRDPDEPRIEHSLDGCRASGPSLAAVLDLHAGQAAISALSGDALWTYERDKQSWSATALPVPKAVRAGWLLGEGRVAASVLQLPGGLKAYAPDLTPRWSWSGTVTRGPFAARSAISWQGRAGKNQPLATYWATAEDAPRVVATPLADAPPRAQALVDAGNQICYAGPAAHPVQCLDKRSGLVRAVCDSRGDCGFSGSVPSLQLAGDGNTVALGRPGAALETIAFTEPELTAPRLPPAPLLTRSGSAPGLTLEAGDAVLGTVAAVAFPLGRGRRLLAPVASVLDVPQRLTAGSVAMVGSCLWFTQPPRALYRYCSDDHELQLQPELLGKKEIPRFLRSHKDLLFLIGRGTLVIVRDAGRSPMRASQPQALPLAKVEAALVDDGGLWLAGGRSLLRVTDDGAVTVTTMTQPLRELYLTATGPLWWGRDGRAERVGREPGEQLDQLVCTSLGSCVGLRGGRLLLLDGASAAATQAAVATPLPRELSRLLLRISEDGQQGPQVLLAATGRGRRLVCRARLGGGELRFACAEAADELPAGRRLRAGPFSWWRNSAAPDEDSGLTLNGRELHLINDHFAHDVLAPGPLGEHALLTRAHLWLLTVEGLVRYPLSAASSGRLAFADAEWVDGWWFLQHRAHPRPGAERAVAMSRQDGAAADWLPGAITALASPAESALCERSGFESLRLRTKTDRVLEVRASPKSSEWSTGVAVPRSQLAVSAVPDPIGSGDAKVMPGEFRVPFLPATQEPALQLLQLAAALGSLEPVGADDQGIIFHAAGVGLLHHAGQSYCGPGCLHLLHGDPPEQQLRTISLHHGLSAGVVLRCATATSRPPQWACTMQRPGEDAERLPLTRLFPSDRIDPASLDQDERGGVHLADELHHRIDVDASGALSPSRPRSASPASRAALQAGGWTWPLAAESGARLLARPDMRVERAGFSDALRQLPGQTSAQGRLGHDFVIDAVGLNDRRCAGCVYSLARLTASDPPPPDGDSAKPLGLPVLVRGNVAGAAPQDDKFLRLPALPQGLLADGEGVLLAFSDRAVLLDHDLSFRKAVYPLRWPAAVATGSVVISRVPGSDQVLLAREPLRTDATLLLEPLSFRSAEQQPEPPVTRDRLLCDEEELPADIGDRCGALHGDLTLTLARYLPDGRTWRGQRYRVRSPDASFCHAAAVRCTAQLSEGREDATYAVLYEPAAHAARPGLGEASQVLFSTGALIGDGRRAVLPAGGFVAEVLAQQEEWQTQSSDALLRLHPVARLWRPASCGDAVSVIDGAVVSQKGCAAAAIAPAGTRLWLPPPQSLHTAIARFVVGRRDNTLPLASLRAAGQLALSGTEMIISRGPYRFEVLRSEAILPP